MPSLSPLSAVPTVGRDRGQLASLLDGRYGPLDPAALHPVIAWLAATANLAGVGYAVDIPEGGCIRPSRSPRPPAFGVVLATIWQPDLPGVISFAEAHDPPPVTGKHIYGLAPGDHAIVVEDEVTSGQTVVNCVRAMRAAGIRCNQVATIYAADDAAMRSRLYGREHRAARRELLPGRNRRPPVPLMAPSPTDVEAIIQAAGQGTRLGRGPKAFVIWPAARCSSGRLRRCCRLPRGSRLRFRQPTSNVPAAWSATHASASSRAARAEPKRCARWSPPPRHLGLVLHATVHPLTTVVLAARRVLARARRCGSAAAALPTVDFLEPGPTACCVPRRAKLSVQKPVAFRREVIARGFALADRSRLAGDPSVLELLALAGVPAEFVPGHRANLKLTTADDLEFARALRSAIASVQLPRRSDCRARGSGARVQPEGQCRAGTSLPTQQGPPRGRRTPSRPSRQITSKHRDRARARGRRRARRCMRVWPRSAPRGPRRRRRNSSTSPPTARALSCSAARNA